MKKQILFYNVAISILCFFIPQKAVAQQFTYSQFWANKAALNPAFAVSESGLRIYAQWREQTPKISTNLLFRQYSTAITANRAITSNFLIGYGAFFNRSREGEALYTNHNFGGIIGAGVPFSIKKRNAIVAVSGAFHRNTSQIDWDKLVFSDELHPVRTDITYTSNAVRPENLKNSFPTYRIGIVGILPLMTYKPKNKKHHFTRLIAGYTQYRFSKDNANFIDNYTAFAPRHTIHAGLEWNVEWKNAKDEGVTFYPNVKLEFQNYLSSINAGFMFVKENYTPLAQKKDRENKWILGAFVQRTLLNNPYKNENIPPQHTTNIIGVASFQWNPRHSIGMSWDMGVSGLEIGHTAGNFELAYTWRIPEAKVKSSKKGKNAKQNIWNRLINPFRNTGSCPRWNRGDAMKT